MRYIELRRHTDNNGDCLTPDGVKAAEQIARTSINPPYTHFVSTGIWRTIQMVEILRKGAKQENLPIIEESELRSSAERRWRAAAQQAGENPTLEDIRVVEPQFVLDETRQFTGALRGIFARIPEGGRALVVGHSPMNEAAVLGLTGTMIAPMDKGKGVLIVEDEGKFEVSPLP